MTHGSLPRAPRSPIIDTNRFLHLVLFVAALPAAVAAAGPGAPPWQHALVRDTPATQVHAISAEAEVTVSDGGHFRAVTHYRSPGRAVFHREEPERSVTLGVDGHYVWHYDGIQEQEIDAALAAVVRGHQFHAELLFLPVLHDARSPSPAARDDGCDCMVQTYETDEGNVYRYRYDEDTGLPQGSITSLADGSSVELTYLDWREVGGLYLPFHIQIDDHRRTFDYRFTDIRFDQDERAEYRAPYGLLTDEQQLRRLHRLSMDAHLDSDASLINDQWAEQVTIVSDGKIYTQSGADTATEMTESLQARRHDFYEELEPPRIEVSEDGTLGTVTVRVQATGVRMGATETPFEFVSAWTSVYRKSDGEWRLVSNTSNFEPPSN